ncbi:hypothetical protein AGLY_006346 [Aphis glycines]|uniref:Uncharacterized protein n=1 Tax=Aphis glycines TaxID=307491 RepID=A0A6G0TQZ7_APHGL|nr:hypothetical protein AGLY_006346 [Aphis glycines]
MTLYLNDMRVEAYCGMLRKYHNDKREPTRCYVYSNGWVKCFLFVSYVWSFNNVSDLKRIIKNKINLVKELKGPVMAIKSYVSSIPVILSTNTGYLLDDLYTIIKLLTLSNKNYILHIHAVDKIQHTSQKTSFAIPLIFYGWILADFRYFNKDIFKSRKPLKNLCCNFAQTVIWLRLGKSSILFALDYSTELIYPSLIFPCKYLFKRFYRIWNKTGSCNNNLFKPTSYLLILLKYIYEFFSYNIVPLYKNCISKNISIVTRYTPSYNWMIKQINNL